MGIITFAPDYKSEKPQVTVVSNSDAPIIGAYAQKKINELEAMLKRASLDKEAVIEKAWEEGCQHNTEKARLIYELVVAKKVIEAAKAAAGDGNNIYLGCSHYQGWTITVKQKEDVKNALDEWDKIK